MCGRYGFKNPNEQSTIDLIRQAVVAETTPRARALLVPRYNIAPSQPVVAARVAGKGDDARVQLDALRWGLIPSWAKDAKIGNSLANARSETIAEKPSFRGAWKAGRRCLVLADLFYEWQDAGDATDDPRNGDAPGTPASGPSKRTARAPKPPKQPFAIGMTDGAAFAFGGLWEAWRTPVPDASGEPWLYSCTLITTAPNGLMRPIHDRMPVIVPRSAYGDWLDPRLPLDEAAGMLTSYPAAEMGAYPVSTWVNDPRHDDPTAAEPMDVRDA